MAVMGNVHIGKCLPYSGCSISDSSRKDFVCLTVGFWGFLQLVCHVLYSWTLSGLCAAYDHSSYGCGYHIKVHGPCGIILDDSAGADTRNSRCSSSNGWYVSRGFFPPGCVGPSVCILVVVLMKIWVSAEDHPTADMLVGRNAGMNGAPGKWVDGWAEINREALPCGLGTPACWEIPKAKEFFSCPLVGESSTQLNMVIGGGWQLSVGLSIPRPSNMSHVVVVMNSPHGLEQFSSISAKGQTSRLIGG